MPSASSARDRNVSASRSRSSASRLETPAAGRPQRRPACPLRPRRTPPTRPGPAPLWAGVPRRCGAPCGGPCRWLAGRRRWPRPHAGPRDAQPRNARPRWSRRQHWPGLDGQTPAVPARSARAGRVPARPAPGPAVPCLIGPCLTGIVLTGTAAARPVRAVPVRAVPDRAGPVRAVLARARSWPPPFRVPTRAGRRAARRLARPGPGGWGVAPPGWADSAIRTHIRLKVHCCSYVRM